MRTSSLALAFVLVAAPLAAHADSWSGCLLGPSDLNRCSITGAPAAALAAIAAPVLVAGAAVTIAGELDKRIVERAPDGVQRKTGQRPTLTLVPEPPDPYRARAGQPEKRRAPDPAVQFNETATNVAIGVTGAMVVGAIIANLAHK